MLELRKYKKEELAAIIGTNDNQSIKRKLERNKVEYQTTGRGNSIVFEITAIKDPFKIYALWYMNIDPHADFTKIRNLYYYLFCFEGFTELPLYKQSELLRDNNHYVSEQTITKWTEYLDKLGWIDIDRSNCRYYAIKKDDLGNKYFREIDRKLYSAGWKIYWELKETYTNNGEMYPTAYAYRAMYNLIDGHPYKKATIVHNAFYVKHVNYLIDLINESYLNELDDR